MTDVQISLPRLLGARGASFAGAALIAAVVLWVAGYAAGLWPWLGYAGQSSQSLNIGNFPIGRDESGQTRLGLSTFLYVAGQNIVVAYDANIGAGCLSLHVWRIAGADANRCVDASGKGEWTVPVTRTGLYHIYAAPRSVGGRWAMSYSIWWGARS